MNALPDTFFRETASPIHILARKFGLDKTAVRKRVEQAVLHTIGEWEHTFAQECNAIFVEEGKKLIDRHAKIVIAKGDIPEDIVRGSLTQRLHSVYHFGKGPMETDFALSVRSMIKDPQDLLNVVERARNYGNQDEFEKDPTEIIGPFS